MKRWLKRIGLAAALLFAGIQLIRPERTNPPAAEGGGLEIHPVFRRACADCHSNETRWPWYSAVAPTSWFVAGHVNHARSHLNLSEWSGLDAEEADHRLSGICRLARKGSMPLPSYLWIHRDARLSEADLADLCAWADEQRGRIAK